VDFVGAGGAPCGASTPVGATSDGGAGGGDGTTGLAARRGAAAAKRDNVVGVRPRRLSGSAGITSAIMLAAANAVGRRTGAGPSRSADGVVGASSLMIADIVVIAPPRFS